MNEHIVVLCTCATEAEATQIAAALIERRLAACVHIAAPVRSVYRWQGKIESASEWPLLIKTTAGRFPALTEAVQALHSYETPEIIALPIAAGSPPYLNWIAQSVHD